MTRVYYREAVGALVVFDMTRASTFQAVLKWKKDLDSKVALGNGRPLPAVLLANKCDQQRHGLCSKLPKLDNFSRDHGFVGWYETSAKVQIIGYIFFYINLCSSCTSEKTFLLILFLPLFNRTTQTLRQPSCVLCKI